jgi:hypothetical protein
MRNYESFRAEDVWGPIAMTKLRAGMTQERVSVISARVSRHYLIQLQGEPASSIAHAERLHPINANHLKESTMRKTVLTILAASVIVASTVEIAAAAGRHTHRSDRAGAPASQQFRDANDSLPSPSIEEQHRIYYSEAHGMSAPAGH